MSEYSAFFAQDFASRCRELLAHFYVPAKARDREVTLLLAVAAAGLVIPLERLIRSKKQPHVGDVSHPCESEQFKVFLSEAIANSKLIGGFAGSWKGGLLRSAEGPPDQWPEMRNEEALPATTKVLDLVYWLRHGLAHGNITTRIGAHRTIARLVFVCGYQNSETHPLRYVSVTPDDLSAFLVRWFSCLVELGVSRAVLAELLNADEAA